MGFNYMTKVIKKKYPDYDPNHSVYDLGTVVYILTYGRGIVIDNRVMGAECVITKTIFGFKEGQRVEVPYTSITGHEKPVLTKRLTWKVGDVFEDSGCLFCLYESDNKGGGYAIALQDVKEKSIYAGAGYYVMNPYRHYIREEY